MIILAIAIVCVTNGYADDTAPEWLRQAARSPVKSYDKDVDAVVLLNEEFVTLEGGRLITVERRAIKVLQKEGVADAVARAFYLSNFSSVKDLEAWLIGPGGETRAFGKKETVDRISDTDDIYNEGRIKTISAASLADVGYVFGYTSTTEDKPLFYQHQYSFQDTHPTLVSRFSLSIPGGWSASGMTFNREQVPAQTNGNTYVWELRDLPPIAIEPMSPTFTNLIPRIAINYGPSGEVEKGSKVFADWVDVSNWATPFYEPQVIIDDAVSAKARELTANAKTELDKIKAIGRFVQNIQYISIDIGVGYGNGMKPRASNTVLGRGYGDCKDKANLMRALLKVVGIEAYPVVIYSGDPNFVRKEWPSPNQFNHCIIAVRIKEETTAATVATHPKLGRLLIFDATDPYTPVGDLPDSLQGSNGVILAGENGGLFEMPVTNASFNAWNRESEIALDANGGIKGVIRERVSGQESRGPRTLFRSASNDEFRKAIEYWLTRGATAARLISFKPSDNQDDASFNMDIEFSAASYGQLMQNRLLIFKPAIANRTSSIYLTEKMRKHPINFESNSFNEKVVFDLPEGFDVDEMPDPVNITVPFGSYESTYEVKGRKLHYTRSFITKRVSVPVERYEIVRNFFAKMRDVEQTPVVLIRK